jgi:hypothetical protein
MIPISPSASYSEEDGNNPHVANTGMDSADELGIDTTKFQFQLTLDDEKEGLVQGEEKLGGDLDVGDGGSNPMVRHHMITFKHEEDIAEEVEPSTEA